MKMQKDIDDCIERLLALDSNASLDVQQAVRKLCRRSVHYREHGDPLHKEEIENAIETIKESKKIISEIGRDLFKGVYSPSV